jgi:hypothetical protein
MQAIGVHYLTEKLTGMLARTFETIGAPGPEFVISFCLLYK